jgi:hypothetical protein
MFARLKAAAKPKRLQQAMALPLPRDQADDIALGYYLTLESLRAGAGHRYHISSLAQATYMVMLLNRANYGVARPELFHEATQAILHYREANFGTHAGKLDEQTYVLLGEVLRVFDQQLKVAPVRALKVANEKLKTIFNPAESVVGDTRHVPCSGDSNDTIAVRSDEPATAPGVAPQSRDG